MSKLEDVITQYVVLDKALLLWYNDLDTEQTELSTINIMYEWERFDELFHSYVRSTQTYKINKKWNKIKDGFKHLMPRR